MKLPLLTLIFILLIGAGAHAQVYVFGKLPPEVEKIINCQELIDMPKSKKSTKAKTKKATKAKKTTTAQPTTTLWYTAIELGDYDMWVMRDPQTGKRRALGGTFISGGKKFDRDFSDLVLEFMPNAKDNQPAYYAQIRHDTADDSLSVELYPLEERAAMDKIIDKELDLVWKVYKEQGTVTDKEIRAFKKQEAQLDPQRKMTFATQESLSSDTLSVMRVYDGTPFPGMYFGDFGEHFDYKGATDKRVPVERRYPEKNFREHTDYIFEAGRLAKDARVNDALVRLLEHFASHLMTKYGYEGIVPKDYLQGRIYFEVTDANYTYAIKPRAQGGFGFKKFYQPPRKKNEAQKYVVYTTVQDLIQDFVGPIKVKQNSAYARITVTTQRTKK